MLRVSATTSRTGKKRALQYMGNWGQESYPSLEQLGALPPPALRGISSEAAGLLLRLRVQRDTRRRRLERRDDPAGRAPPQGSCGARG